jgi:hypothetical protein
MKRVCHPQDEWDRLEQKVITNIAKYYDNVISVQKCYEWLVVNTWDIDIDVAHPSLKNLIYAAKLRFAEYTNGHWTESDLKERLLELIL